MTGEGFFLDVAKVSITAAGFAGVIAALRHPKDGEWKANELAGVKLILEHSLAGVLFGLLPSVLYLSLADEPTVWLLSSSLLCLFLVAEVLGNIFRIKTSTELGAPPRTFPYMLGLWFLPTIAVLIVQVINVLFWQGVAVFAIGVLWLVLASFRQFWLFFYHIQPEKQLAEIPKEKVEGGVPV